MDFKRGMNKKAQEGMTLTTLLAIIVGVVAVVVIVLFVTGFFNKVQGGTDQLPSDLQAAVSACEIDGSSGLTADYCSTFRKVTVNGVEQYQTCASLSNYLQENKRLKDSCGTLSDVDPAAFCASKKLDKGILVGSYACDPTRYPKLAGESCSPSATPTQRDAGLSCIPTSQGSPTGTCGSAGIGSVCDSTVSPSQCPANSACISPINICVSTTGLQLSASCIPTDNPSKCASPLKCNAVTKTCSR